MIGSPMAVPWSVWVWPSYMAFWFRSVIKPVEWTENHGEGLEGFACTCSSSSCRSESRKHHFLQLHLRPSPNRCRLFFGNGTSQQDTGGRPCRLPEPNRANQAPARHLPLWKRERPKKQLRDPPQRWVEPKRAGRRWHERKKS